MAPSFLGMSPLFVTFLIDKRRWGALESRTRVHYHDTPSRRPTLILKPGRFWNSTARHASTVTKRVFSKTPQLFAPRQKCGRFCTNPVMHVKVNGGGARRRWVFHMKTTNRTIGQGGMVIGTCRACNNLQWIPSANELLIRSVLNARTIQLHILLR